eukprot:5879270-Pleurochrysis_carterae.AAC.1
MFSAAQLPPGRNSATWLRVAEAIAVKAADSKRPTSESSAASWRMRTISRAARRAPAVSFYSRTPSMKSSSVPSITAAGEVTACSKKAGVLGHIFGSSLRMCASEPIARSSI